MNLKENYFKLWTKEVRVDTTLEGGVQVLMQRAKDQLGSQVKPATQKINRILLHLQIPWNNL